MASTLELVMMMMMMIPNHANHEMERLKFSERVAALLRRKGAEGKTRRLETPKSATKGYKHDNLFALFAIVARLEPASVNE